MSNDFIPKKDEAFKAFSVNFTGRIIASGAKYGIPDDGKTALSGSQTAFNTALDIAEAPATRTPVTIEAKKLARDALETAIRQTINQYLRYNPACLETDRLGLGLPVPDTTHTPVPPPATVPEAEAKTPHPMVVEIHFHDEGKEKRGKPAGVQGAKILYAVLDSPPSTVEGLNQSAFDTHSPFTLTFQENQRGKALYFALHWENAKGQAGPWSVIQKAIIA